MKKKENHLEKNISRLVKLTAESGRPSEAFMEDLISEATKELTRQQRTGAGRLGMSRTVRWAGVAAAAVVIVGVGVLFYSKEPGSVVEEPGTARVEKAPAELLTMMSLNLAYRRGGMEAVDKQYEKAFKRTGPPPEKLTVEDLFAELNGG
jgi:hypothetical protein